VIAAGRPQRVTAKGGDSKHTGDFRLERDYTGLQFFFTRHLRAFITAGVCTKR
jgi:hypothetical protein